jgi:hypothetical protein
MTVHYYRQQLRLQIGDEAFDAIPDRKPQGRARPKRPAVQRRPRIEARQRIILCGLVPAVIAAGFTCAEIAALAVIASEIKRRGFCNLTIGEIAYLAQCCDTIVQRALRQAIRYGLIKVDYRRVAYNRNLPNIIRIISRVWIAWLRLGPSRPRPWGGGVSPSAAKQPNDEGGRVYETKHTPADTKNKSGCPNNGPGGLRPSRRH